MASTQCTVPLSKLTSSPFNLLLGYSINIKVVATNDYGDSEVSDPGNGGVIVLVPDPPLNLQNDPSVTDKATIRFTWTDGASDGGETIIDYRVSYDQATGNYVELASGLTVQGYTTSVTLTAGRTYSFKVEARNSVGYSAVSDKVSILAAQAPDKPAAPVTSVDGDNIVISWTIPEDGASSITSYFIVIRQNDDATYSENIANCNGQDQAIIES